MIRSTRPLCLALAFVAAVGVASSARSAVPVGVHGGVVHLLVEAEIRRYALATGEALAPMALASEPVAFTAGPSGIYTASDLGSLTRLASDGSEVWTAPLDLLALWLLELVDTGDFVVASNHSTLVTFDAATGAELDRAPILPSMYGFSFDDVSQRIFALPSAGPASFGSIALGPSGEIGDVVLVSSVAGTGTGFRPLAGGARVLGRFGNVLDSGSGAWLDHVHGVFDLFWQGGGRFALARDRFVDLYDDSTLEFLGRVELADAPFAIVDTGAGFLVFPEVGSREPGEPVLIPDEAFGPRPVVAPSSPIPTSIQPSRYELGDDGVLYMQLHQRDAIYRWSAIERRYLEPIALPQGFLSSASPVEWDSSTGHLLVGVGGYGPWGSMMSIDPASPLELHEVQKTRRLPFEITATDDFILMAVDVPFQILTFDRSGQETARFQADDHADQVLVHPGRLFWHRVHDATGSHPIDAAGVVGAGIVVPALAGPPLSASPDGEHLHTRAGEVVNASTLELVTTLEIPEGYREQFSAWTDAALYTLTDGGSSTLDLRSDEYVSIGRLDLFGRAVALVEGAGRLVAVTRAYSRDLHFHAFDVDDFDGDGTDDTDDPFPDDPTEWSDRDGDGVGDNTDVFPDDATEQSDSDGDGVGDNADAFPFDPTEWLDSDGDGVPDTTDEFPFDGDEWLDSDGDGVGDNGDPFPDDASEWSDRDGDGVGDNTDVFPDDPEVAFDSDGDGIGDAVDRFPIGEPALWFTVEGRQKLMIKRGGYLKGDLVPIEIGLVPGGVWSGCFEGGCLWGTWRERFPRRRTLRFDLEFYTGFFDDLGEGLAEQADEVLGRRGSTVTFQPETLRFTLKIRANGTRAKLKMEVRHESSLAGFASGKGKYKWKMGRAPVTWREPGPDPGQL